MNEEREVKQYIIARKDLKMHKGKLVAQGSHASLGALLKLAKKSSNRVAGLFGDNVQTIHTIKFDFVDGDVLDKWLNGIFTKVCLSVNSDEELVSLYEKITAEHPEIPAVLITDAGLTVFNGVPTNTCVGIGPWYADELEQYVGNLKLY